MYKHSDTQFKCQVCKSVFRTINVMQNCIWSHSGHRNESDLSCKICRTRFATRNGIRKHIHRVHEGEDHAREDCEEMFETGRDLGHHRRLNHKGFKQEQDQHYAETDLTSHWPRIKESGRLAWLPVNPVTPGQWPIHLSYGTQNNFQKNKQMPDEASTHGDDNSDDSDKLDDEIKILEQKLEQARRKELLEKKKLQKSAPICPNLPPISIWPKGE